jgi:hypothetical protein
MSSLRVRMIEDTRRLVIYGGIMVGSGPGTLRAIVYKYSFSEAPRARRRFSSLNPTWSPAIAAIQATNPALEHIHNFINFRTRK